MPIEHSWRKISSEELINVSADVLTRLGSHHELRRPEITIDLVHLCMSQAEISLNITLWAATARIDVVTSCPVSEKLLLSCPVAGRQPDLGSAQSAGIPLRWPGRA
jgi:hypothetical protein